MLRQVLLTAALLLAITCALAKDPSGHHRRRPVIPVSTTVAKSGSPNPEASTVGSSVSGSASTVTSNPKLPERLSPILPTNGSAPNPFSVPPSSSGKPKRRGKGASRKNRRAKSTKHAHKKIHPTKQPVSYMNMFLMMVFISFFFLCLPILLFTCCCAGEGECDIVEGTGGQQQASSSCTRNRVNIHETNVHLYMNGNGAGNGAGGSGNGAPGSNISGGGGPPSQRQTLSDGPSGKEPRRGKYQGSSTNYW